MREQLIISSSEEFIAANLFDYKRIVITGELEPPYLHEESVRLRFETRDSYPENHRITYLHPSRYYEWMFEGEFKEKTYELKKYIKRGGHLVYYYNDQNLSLVCALMALVYLECECEGRDYVGYTNIPYPYKHSDFCPDWVWSCCWSKELPRRIESQEDINKLENENSFKFPRYNRKEFPVLNDRRIEDKEGIIGFTLLIEGGVLEVLPVGESHSNEVVITVHDFPSEYVAGSHQKAKLSCSIFKDDYEANVFHFLKFMTLYYYSNTNQGIAFKVDRDNYLIDLKVYTGDYLIDMPYDFMFMEKDGSNPSNFLTHLQRIIEPVLIPKGCLDSEKLLMKSTVLYREDNQRKYIQGHSSYLQEKLINLKIVFSDEAKENIQSLSMKNLTDDVIMADLNHNLGNFISEIIV